MARTPAPARHRRHPPALLVALVCAVATVLAGCSAAGEGTARVTPLPSPSTSVARSVPTPVTPRASRSPEVDPATYTVSDPGPLDRRLVSADMLVTSQEALPPAVVARVRATPGVREVLAMSWASVPVDGRTLSIVAADPAEFRRFTPGADRCLAMSGL